MVPYLDGATIGIEPVVEQLLEEPLVEAVDSVVERQEDKLGNVILGISTRNLGSTTKTIGQSTVAWITFACLLAKCKGCKYSHKQDGYA